MVSASRIGLVIALLWPMGVLCQEGAAPSRESATSLQAAFINVAREVGPAVVGVYNIQQARIRGFVRRRGGYFDKDD